MIFSHYDFETPLSLTPSQINVLVFEDSEKFYLYSKQLKEQTEGEAGGFSLFDGEKELSLKNIKFISDFYEIPLNEKKLQTALVNSAQSIVDDKLLVEFTELLQNIYSFFDKINAETDFPVAYEPQQGIGALFKSFGVKWEDDCDSLLSGLVSFIQLCSRMLKFKCFAFVNLKSYLNEANLELLYGAARHEEVSLLLIENVCHEKLENEIVTVIDKDFCQFVE